MTIQTTNKIDLSQYIDLCNSRLDNVLQSYMRDIPSLELKSASEYTLLNSGKRLRPLLVYAAGATFNAPLEALDIPAAAMEMVHTYSLIHDDLPCMDDADLRRGKPSCHKEYGEGIAVLTGDGLHTLAMQVLSSHPGPLKAEKRIAMLNIFCHACGPYGMASGQAYDITVQGQNSVSSELLMDIYRLKTGALFTACLELGRLASKDENEVNQRAMRDFGTHIGLAFQIQDDILDITANSAETGKSQGIDQHNKTMTYPKLHGLDKAREKVELLYLKSLEAIDYLGEKAQLLRELAQQMLTRKK
jgi:farnesyl diphosphate synthase